jgi:hypothetical protein
MTERRGAREAALFVSLWAFVMVFDTAWTSNLASFSDRLLVVLAAMSWRMDVQ